MGAWGCVEFFLPFLTPPSHIHSLSSPLMNINDDDDDDDDGFADTKPIPPVPLYAMRPRLLGLGPRELRQSSKSNTIRSVQ